MNDAPRDPRPRAHLERAADADGTAVLRLAGAWRLAGIAAIDAELRALALPPRLVVDATALQELDGAAALALLTHLPAGVQWTGLTAKDARIVDQVRRRVENVPALPPHRRASLLEGLGRRANGLAKVTHGHLAFLGAAVVGLG